MYDVSEFAADGCKGFGPPVIEVDWYRLVAKMAEAPAVRELRSMSDVVKKAHLVVEQHGVRATLGQVAGCRETNGKSGFPWPVEIPNRQRWIKK